MTQAERERSFEKVFWQILRRVSVFAELPRYTREAPETASIAVATPREHAMFCTH